MEIPNHINHNRGWTLIIRSTLCIFWKTSFTHPGDTFPASGLFLDYITQKKLADMV